MGTQDTLTLIQALLSALGAVAMTPAGAALGGVGSILNFAASLIGQGEAGMVELQKLTDEVKAMVAAGRDPTDEEFAALKARSDAAHAAIQAAAGRGPE